MIVVLTQCFPPAVGGIEVLMKGLADALVMAGHDVTVLADGHRDTDEIAPDRRLGYPVLRFAGLKPWRRRAKARALDRLMRNSEVESVFADSWKSVEHAACRLETGNVPIVCLAHGNDVLAKGSQRRRRRIARVLDRTKRVAANSADTARRVHALGVAPERVVVVNPGVFPPEPCGDDVRTSIVERIGGATPVLLTLARIEPRKGQDQVIRAMPGLVAEFPEIGYVVAGGGPYRDQLEELARELGVGAHVRFLGRVSEAEKAALFDEATLFVMPAREDTATQSVEGFGISYVEAAFRGLPSIAGRGGGAGDAVVDGQTGLLCDGSDPESVESSIRNCLADPDRLRRWGDAALQRAESEFVWPVAVRRYLACLE